eukprot:18703-Prorocentrum_minimum.AAC.5
MPRVRNKKQRAESERMLVGCFTIPSISCWLICFFSAALVEPVSRRTWGLRRGPRGLQGKLSKTQSQAKSRSRRSVSWSSAVLRLADTADQANIALAAYFRRIFATCYLVNVVYRINPVFTTKRGSRAWIPDRSPMSYPA